MSLVSIHHPRGFNLRGDADKRRKETAWTRRRPKMETRAAHVPIQMDHGLLIFTPMKINFSIIAIKIRLTYPLILLCLITEKTSPI